MSESRQQTEKYLRKRYEIGVDERDALLKEQNYCCAICGRPRGKINLSVDHDRKIAATKITVTENGNGFEAAITVHGATYIYSAATRKEARQAAKIARLRMSVRGCIDWLCNLGLRKFCDNPVALRAAADYLEAAAPFSEVMKENPDA